MKKEEWGRSGAGLVSDRWPKDEQGRAEESAFLCTRSNTDLSDELTVNMLEACGIPCLRIYPGDGSFGKLILGMSGQGVDIYIPESLYQDAIELSKGENEHEGL